MYVLGGGAYREGIDDTVIGMISDIETYVTLELRV